MLALFSLDTSTSRSFDCRCEIGNDVIDVVADEGALVIGGDGVLSEVAIGRKPPPSSDDPDDLSANAPDAVGGECDVKGRKP